MTMNDDELVGLPSQLHRARWWLQVLFTEGIELQERLLLLNRPWEEDLLHWSATGDLHGSQPPPLSGQHSVTGTGWCPRSGGTSPLTLSAPPHHRR
ncbi:hypothetical protein [Flexivirga endophytica]|nr:hypothetical protein [Flexivirga endophytica]